MGSTKHTEFLSSEEVAKLEEIQREFDDIFSTPTDEEGECPLITVHLPLTDNTPIQCKPIRVSESDRNFIREQIEKWISQGICQKSTSAYAAPCFVVEQSFHETTPRRLVVNYAKTINQFLIPDSQPLDNMEDVIHRVAPKRYKFKADISKGFNNIPIVEEDMHKTAFVTPDGHYEFRRLPFGISIGPAVMTRAIKLAYSHLLGTGVSTYVDDIAFGNDNFTEHAETIRAVFAATHRANFRLLPSKLIMASHTISLFGRLLTPEGIVPDPERTSAILRYGPPSTIHEFEVF